MEVSTAQEWQFLIWSLLTGGILALLYDFLRISRRMIPTKDFVVNLEDILFCVLAAIVLFSAAFLKNEGKIRWHGFIGAIAGFAVYRLTMRNMFVDGSVFLMGWLFKILFFTIKIILFPIMLVYKILRRPFLFIGWYSRKGMRRAAAAARVRKSQMRQKWKNTKQTVSKK